jgi:hypothetical protein
MARWWTSIWLANVLAHGRAARARAPATPAGQGGGGGPRLRRFGPVVLGALVLVTLAVVTLAFVFLWRRIGAKP